MTEVVFVRALVSACSEGRGYMCKVNEFIPLVHVGCSHLLKFFLCSMYAPMCTEQQGETLVIPACRAMCLNVKSDCEPVLERFNFKWPAVLDCSQLPVGGGGGAAGSQLCIDVPTDSRQLAAALDGTQLQPPRDVTQLKLLLNALRSSHNASVILPTPESRDRPAPAGVTSFPVSGCVDSRYVASETDSDSSNSVTSCRRRCGVDVMYSADDKRLTEVCMTVTSLICLLMTSFTCATFLVDTGRFRYPERPVMMVASCSAVCAAVYLIRLAAGSNVVTCDRSRDYVVSGDLRASWCVVTFTLLYFFSTAASLWWLALAVAFYLTAGRKWSREAVADVAANYFHVAVWTLSAVKTSAVIALRRFAGDELTGVCYVSVDDTAAMLGFVVVPSGVYLLLGVGLATAGFIGMVQIRHSLQRTAELVDMRKLEKLMLKMGVFVVVYGVSAGCVVACWCYELTHVTHWRTAVTRSPCTSSDHAYCVVDNSVAPPAVGLLRLVASLTSGVATGLWVCTRKTLYSWRRLTYYWSRDRA